MEREHFASRIGFLFMTAGCAIGLGNVWRFPYIVGKYGGAVFVLVYLLFLILIGFPVMVAELSLGRAAQSDLPGAYKKLIPAGRKNYWTPLGHIAFLGNIVLLMFYSVVTGWMFAYCWKYLTGFFQTSIDCGAYFGTFLGNWKEMLVFDLIGIILTMVVCMIGVRKGIEKTMKIMLGGLFILEFVLICLVARFDGAAEGFRFFLAPSLENLGKEGLWPAIHAAMMQAFFTLSLGIGSIAICGSYIGKDRSLSGESVLIILLDTIAAIAAGLIIFPACFAFNNGNTAQGPALIFITLTKVFQNMPGGRWLGLLFFVFMSVAALSTLIAVGENIIAYIMRMCNLSRGKSSVIFGIGMSLLSLPCLFGFNLMSGFEPFGKGSCVLDLEDFLVSDNLLPLGAIVILLFCTRNCGWGMSNFLAETNTGKGMKFPKFMIFYTKWVLPLMIFCLWAHNMIMKFWK